MAGKNLSCCNSYATERYRDIGALPGSYLSQVRLSFSFFEVDDNLINLFIYGLSKTFICGN